VTAPRQLTTFGHASKRRGAPAANTLNDYVLGQTVHYCQASEMGVWNQ
jgi:hypothetical protein